MSLSVRLIPALVFLSLAALPFVTRLVRKKNILAPLPLVFSAVFLFLATANVSGLINCADYLSRLLGYSGI
ncbi:MAG: hypothetical protein LBG27_13160 [Spirochaetaceae bacterium]|nr:hypothetical protein [Spirochaetaceae bacterium]